MLVSVVVRVVLVKLPSLLGKRKKLDYNFEFLYQFGEFGQGDIHAYALASDTGYTWSLGGLKKLRFSLRADVYSGDDDPNDSDLNSFNQSENRSLR